ncbi:hypothetical protein W911_04110 [Hyphomicrobium nitrativorans NL23]|uniref:Flagellar assembly protein FliH/Type III secretion system HrpE domain-containing protein n=1 Tax=Hyphomicrobium nitrativorans NL23 TaxID=1029756 RepID=V5SHE4_9HYPH|nr:hypothetical protein [Hyphomicrobium nitrativorans]AHB49917.1 hypothetical protein W911_04110 [Hyphomicrobium nitrativorans NL23]
MTATFPVRHYLTEISGDAVRTKDDTGRPGRNAAVEAEARIEEARTRGILDGRAAADAEYAALLAAKDAAFEERLASERQKWAVDEGGRLGNLFHAGLMDVEQRVAEQVGRILKPIFADEVRRAAVSALSQTLTEMLAKGAYTRIAISGPSDLLSALQARVGEVDAALSFVVSERVDLVVHADETVLETRIGAWGKFIEAGAEPATSTLSGAEGSVAELENPPYPTGGAE